MHRSNGMDVERLLSSRTGGFMMLTPRASIRLTSALTHRGLFHSMGRAFSAFTNSGHAMSDKAGGR